MSEQKIHNPDATLEKQDDLGYCGLVIDSQVKDKEIICGEPGTEEILIKNIFGLYAVALCKTHRAQHRDFYNKLRVKKNRRVRKS
jgi:hypothetical protein